MRNASQSYSENLKGSDKLGDLDMDGRIMSMPF
jgi:hypothetical protein